MKWFNERRKISELIPAEYNPRKISDKEKSHLKESLSRFDVADPIIINRNNVVIGGHQRLLVLKDQGVDEVDVRVPERDLSSDEERELNLRLNRNQGEWDFDKLAAFDVDFLKDVGFTHTELDRAFGLREDDFNAAEEYESIVTPVTVYGDVYELGRHRLMCGDAVIIDDLEKLMGGVKAHMIFTDPPYSVNYKSPGGMSYDSKKFGGNGGRIFNDDKTPEEALEFYTQVLKNLFLMTVDWAPLYWWFANRMDWINRKAWEMSGWHRSQVIVWLKNSMIFSQGQDYHRCYEPCMFGWKRGLKHFTNKSISNFKDVFTLELRDFEDMLDVWYQRRDITQDYVHPTQRPIALAERALRKSSERGDIVLDCFGGSGSTLIACEQMDRRCFMQELDPKFVDVIVKRWEKFTGQTAQKQMVSNKTNV